MRGIVAATAAACLLSFGGAVTGAHATDRLPAPCDGSWYPKPIPRSDGYTLNDVAAVGQKDVWIVGTAADGPSRSIGTATSG